MNKLMAKAAGIGAAAVSMGWTAWAAAPDFLQDGVLQSKPTGAQTQLFGDNSIFQTVANILIFIVGAVAVIMLIIGGLRYVLSSGDDKAVQGAKNTILYAIIGVVVAILAFAAVNFVVTQFENSGGV
jgi:hypothetical protein